MNTIGQLLTFMAENKKLWMLPVVLVMLALGGLMVLVKGSALAPLIYAIF